MRVHARGCAQLRAPYAVRTVPPYWSLSKEVIVITRKQTEGHTVGTIAYRPTHEQEERLDALAKRTGRPKSFYLKEAVDRHLDELEDLYEADDVIDRWEKSDQKTRPLSELRIELGL